MNDAIDRARREQEDYLFDGLSQYVLRCFNAAKNHKSSIGATEAIEKSLRAYTSQYTAEEKQKFSGIDSFVGLTGMLCRTAESWITDAYLQVDDKPWTIAPTPSASLPDRIRNQIKEAANSRLAELMSSGIAITSEDQYDVERTMKLEAERMAQEEALKAINGMTTLISDQLHEGGWREAFEKFRRNALIYPTAIIKAGTFRRDRRAVWNGDAMEVKDTVIRAVENVNPAYVFPSPDSTDTQDGEYLIELIPMSRSKLIACVNLPNFFREALQLVLYDFPTGASDVNGSFMPWLRATLDNDVNTYLVYDFHGYVNGSDILSFYSAEGLAEEAKRDDKKVSTPLGDIDPYATYNMNVWLCGGKVIRMIHNPDPLGTRPYFSTSYSKVPECFWGQGIPQLVEGSQFELNAASRSRVFNMGIASGPLVEIDVDRMGDGERIEQIEPWRIYYTTGSIGSGSAPAIKFNNANSNSAELTAVMRDCWNTGHDLAGLPPYTRGVDQGAAQTLGAFSMQFNAASKGIRRVMSNIDVGIIEPVIRTYYTWNMFESDDDTIKADAQVKPLGVVGLLRKEAQEVEPLDVLTKMGPMVERFPKAVDVLLGEFLTKRGYDPASMGVSVPTRVASGLGPNAVETANQGTADPLAPPEVDGRSGQAGPLMAGARIPGG